jgi:hypothetical protein
MLWSVAGTATDASVFSIKHESGLRVVKALWSRVPVQQREVLAIMVRVAFHAGRARRTRTRKGRVEPLVLLLFIRNLAMAFYTAKSRGLRGNLMTLDAVSRSAQVLMRAGKRAWRNLRIRNSEDNRKHPYQKCWYTRSHRHSEPMHKSSAISVLDRNPQRNRILQLRHSPILVAYDRIDLPFALGSAGISSIAQDRN